MNTQIIPRNLTQLKKFFAPGMEIRSCTPWTGEPVTVPLVKVQHNAIVMHWPDGRNVWVHWDKPSTAYRFDEKGFEYDGADKRVHRFEYVTLTKPEVIETPKAPKPNPDLLTGPNAFQEARKKARYGHKNWVCYRAKDGTLTAEKLTSESLKRALLAIGTSGRFTEIEASNGWSYGYCWSTGINRLNHARYVEKHGPLF